MSLPTDAAARKAIPVYSGFVVYFPDAIAAVAQLSQIANEQHNPGTDVHWDRSKSKDELDAMMRHTLDMAGGMESDADGVLHATKQAWRSMANLQKLLESKKHAAASIHTPMTATEVQERWKARRAVSPRMGYIRYTGNGPGKGWWWCELGKGLTDNLNEAHLYPEGYNTESSLTEFVPKNEAVDKKSCWILCGPSGYEWTTAGLYTASEVARLFAPHYVSVCRI